MKNPILHYQRLGNGKKKTITLLHGFLGSLRDWQPLFTQLKKFDIVAVDLPFHGSSKNIDKTFSFEETADSIIYILDNEDIQSTTLLGYSLGGRIALYTALSYPHRFSHLILESCTPGIQTEQERHERKKFESKIIAQLETQSITDFIRDWYNMRLFNSIRSHPQFQALVSQRIQNDPSALINAIKNLGTSVMPSLWDRLSQLDVPIHFLYGEHDKKYKSIAAGIQERGKNVSLYKIKNGGHNTHFENPAEFCTVVKTILNEE